jgi:hypothetical protein
MLSVGGGGGEGRKELPPTSFNKTFPFRLTCSNYTEHFQSVIQFKYLQNIITGHHIWQ